MGGQQKKVAGWKGCRDAAYSWVDVVGDDDQGIWGLRPRHVVVFTQAREGNQ